MEATVSPAKYEADILVRDQKISVLQHELDQLKRLIFGATSERFVPTVPDEQLDLFTEVAGAANGKEEQSEEQSISYSRRKPKAKPHPGRTPLPEHLPRRKVAVEPEEDTTGMVKIGEDITTKVDYTPGKLEVIEYVRPRYARPEAEQTEGTPAIVQAPAPDQVLPKAIAGAGLLTQLVVAKYIDHLPLHRQQQMFKRDFDWCPAASTLGDWLAATCTLLEPLYEALQKLVLATDYLQGDESRITVLERGPKDKKHKDKSHRFPPKDRKSHLGYMWVFRNPLAGAVLFAYRPGRGANVLHETLADYQGYLQSDGYSAYTAYLKRHEGVQLVSCLAHIRRKFFDAQSNHRALAEKALRDMQYLYRVERIARDYNLSPERRQALRHRFARPKYDALLNWVKKEKARALQKDGISRALGYAVNHLPRLAAYLEDGRIEIDNNQIENKIRPLALGRSDQVGKGSHLRALFAGSKEGARRAAMMYSFFATCKDQGINPREWLHDVLLHIGSHPINRIEELLPAAWAAARDKEEK